MLLAGTSNAWRGIVRLATAMAIAGAPLLIPVEGFARTSPVPDDTETESVEYEAVRIGGTFEFPWSIAFLPDRSLLLTERVGRLQHVRPDGTAREVKGAPAIFNGGLAGLLDVAVDPDFSRSRLIYFSYAYGNERRSTVRVARARLSHDNASLMAKTVIFESSASARDEQYGGRIAITLDGHLFLTVGDRWEQERAQRLDDHLGTVIRIRTDGSVPPDNPFYGRKDVKPEIWSYGHRVSQGLAFDEERGHLYAVEHGPMGGDELNLIERGRNYGWPVISHGIGYDGKPVGEGRAKEGMQQPAHVFGEPPAQAPSGLAIDGGGTTPIFWVGTLAGQALLRLERDGDGERWRETRLLHEELGRIRDVRIGPDGLVYVITDAAEGALYRVDPIVEQAGQRQTR
ncbi:MAG: PQQ-dependent sugar dehydrogenase [Pseudorhodoplanes sp.]|uniref:PQQ-dependent sugar dehydrogenase n=1 Tax=Pseudorhodoplanes sp. TaxID=1934341 RepID=UPI003D0D511F